MRVGGETIFARATALMEAEIEDEIVALDVDRGLCFGFNPVAASVWKLLGQPRSFAEISSALLDEYDVSAKCCAEEVHVFLGQAVGEGLVEIVTR